MRNANSLIKIFPDTAFQNKSVSFLALRVSYDVILKPDAFTS